MLQTFRGRLSLQTVIDRQSGVYIVHFDQTLPPSNLKMHFRFPGFSFYTQKEAFYSFCDALFSFLSPVLIVPFRIQTLKTKWIRILLFVQKKVMNLKF